MILLFIVCLANRYMYSECYESFEKYQEDSVQLDIWLVYNGGSAYGTFVFLSGFAFIYLDTWSFRVMNIFSSGIEDV